MPEEAEPMTAKVKDNPAWSRYELSVDDAVAFVAYETGEGRLILTHTEVPKELAGRGIGSALARGVLDDLRAGGVKVIPRCPFIAGFIERHPEYRGLIAAGT
jgi:predicted GNAT family acetyltransferase